MSSGMLKQKKISFPRLWEYRLFFPAAEAAEAAEKIRETAAGSGVKVEVVPGHRSAGGSYCAFHVSGMVDSLETAEQLGNVLKTVPGVKFLL